jgi:predicted membrane protein
MVLGSNLCLFGVNGGVVHGRGFETWGVNGGVVHGLGFESLTFWESMAENSTFWAK